MDELKEKHEEEREEAPGSVNLAEKGEKGKLKNLPRRRFIGLTFQAVGVGGILALGIPESMAVNCPNNSCKNGNSCSGAANICTEDNSNICVATETNGCSGFTNTCIGANSNTCSGGASNSCDVGNICTRPNSNTCTGGSATHMCVGTNNGNTCSISPSNTCQVNASNACPKNVCGTNVTA